MNRLPERLRDTQRSSAVRVAGMRHVLRVADAANVTMSGLRTRPERSDVRARASIGSDSSPYRLEARHTATGWRAADGACDAKRGADRSITAYAAAS